MPLKIIKNSENNKISFVDIKRAQFTTYARLNNQLQW
jgi:hypothetical protein